MQTCNKTHTLVGVLTKPIKSSLYLYLLLLNIISNCGDLVYGQNLFAIFSTLMLAAPMAYLEVAIYKLLFLKWPRIIFLILISVYHNVLIISDYFLIYQFHMAIGQDVIDILAETNPVEIENFVKTYLSFFSLLSWLVLILILNLLIIWLAKVIKRTHYLVPAIVCVLVGISIMILCIYNFAIYRNGMSIPQYQTTTRLGYSLYVMNQRMQKIEEVIKKCKRVKAVSTLDEKPTVVVVIGESFCVYHSSLYGYSKTTNPLLQKRVDDGSMQVFDNVVSISSGTHGAMLSVFSLDSLGNGFEKLPLFPICFKAAGYQTEMFDNQYFVGSGVNFLANSELSSLLFDQRNTERYPYDLELVETIQTQDAPTLYVIHLWGQHYTYSQRYPPSFRHFKATDYDTKRWSEDEREIIAHYDNATLYNDYVVNEIIKKFENKNSCVVYFSDHGEEIYDLSSYMGHGNAEHSSNLSYQIRVPLFVWTSPAFSRPKMKERLVSSANLPLMTDDISHFLLDIAGIKTEGFCPTRSFVNPAYNKAKPRIVLNSINYDELFK